jgi:GT2 family glycosyltransferase
MTEPKVLISILNWNSPENTYETVKSVILSEYKNYEIILLDNHSSDHSTVFFSKSFPDIQLIQLKKNMGYAGAHKVSAQIAKEKKYDLLWILNNDVEVFPSALKELVNAYMRNGEVILGSIALALDRCTINFGGGLEMLDQHTADEKSGYNVYANKNITEVEMNERFISGVEGSSFLIPVNIIKKYGFINTRYFLYGEETEYCYRLRKKYNVQTSIVPASRVIHHSGQSFKNEKLKWVRAYYLTRNNNIVLNKYLRENKILEMSLRRIPHYLKYFLKHFLLNFHKEKDFNYWFKYYTELGNLHSLLRITGKYLSPEKFLN